MSNTVTALVRHLKLLRMLAGYRNGVSVKELSQETGVSEKTIRRDLELFAASGIMVTERKEEYGRKIWCLDPQHATPQIGFTFDEALALSLLRNFLGPLVGSPIGAAAQSAIGKVRACLGREVVKYIDKMLPKVYATQTGNEDYSRKSEIVDQLLIGMEDRKVVFITYQSQRATEPVTYDIHPYSLAVHRGALYLVGFAPQHNEIRHWKVSRIEQAEVDPMPFTMPAEFRIEQHLSGCFGIYHGKEDVQIKIRFTAAAARQVAEGNWHRSQILHPQHDGSLIAEFKLNSTVEIKQWVLSFGGQAEVLEPIELRQEIGEELAHLVRAYRESPKSTRTKTNNASRRQ